VKVHVVVVVDVVDAVDVVDVDAAPPLLLLLPRQRMVLVVQRPLQQRH
jgi:hypothetical protein